MRFLPLLAALMLLLLVSIGTASASVAITSSDPSDETVAITNAATALTFSGSNDQVTQPFSWDAGLMVVSWTSAGGLLIVHLVDTNGETVEYLISQYDEGPGSFAVNVDHTGQYMLEVDGDEPWTVTLSAALYSTTSTTFSGTNNQVTPAFYCTPGRLDAAWTVNDGIFIVHLIDDNGETVDYIASQYDKGPGSSVSSVKRAGYYMLTVEAGSPWTVALSGAVRTPTVQPTAPPTPAPTPVYVPPVIVPTPVPTPLPTVPPVYVPVFVPVSVVH